jgi:hypothetical protein
VGLGVTFTAYGSFIFSKFSGPIPYKLIPDVRAPILFLAGFWLGGYASFGRSSHRTWALWGVIGFIIGFHLEEATVHWIGPYPGSITGTDVGPLGTGGSLLALAGVVLVHLEVESAKLARDLDKRGAGRQAALAVVAGLRGLGQQRVWGLAVGVAALGLLIFVAQRILGNTATGGVYILFLGSGLLFALALIIVRIGRK